MAVYDDVYVPEHSLDYYVIDAVNYSYSDYKYSGEFTANAGSIIANYGYEYSEAFAAYAKESATDEQKKLVSAVMDDFARYMGALYRNAKGEVTSVYFDGKEYNWYSGDGELKGSNWTEGGAKVVGKTNTLVSAVTLAVNKGVTQIVMEISNGSQKQALTYVAAFADEVPETYEVTLKGEGVAFYLDGCRLPAGTYELVEGDHTLIVEVLSGYEGTLEIPKSVKDCMFEVTGEMTIEVTGADKIKSYTVELKGYGYMTVEKGDSITLPAVSETGKIFLGWSTDEKATTGTQGFYTPKDNVVLYAVYEEIEMPEEYNVTLKGEGVAFYVDGLRYSAGIYKLVEGDHTFVAELLPGYTGDLTITGATDGVFTVVADKALTIEVKGADKITAPGYRNVTISGDGVAFYLDGLRYVAGTYSLVEGAHTFFAELLPGYEGTLTITGVENGKFTVGNDAVKIAVDGAKKIAEPVSYTVELKGYGYMTVEKGDSITLPTVSESGKIFLGWSTDEKATTGTQGFYTPTKDVTLYAVFAAAESYSVSTSYKGDDVTLAFNSSITKESFGLLVVTPKKANVTYDVSLTGASLATLSDGSYMIFNVTDNVVITVTTETLNPSGFQTFSVVGALADNKGFRVEMTSIDKGGLYGGNVTLVYTYCKVVEGKDTYFATTSAPKEVEEGTVAWRRDYEISEGTMYYAYAVYTYADGAEQSVTAQTLGVVAPSIPAVTA